MTTPMATNVKLFLLIYLSTWLVIMGTNLCCICKNRTCGYCFILWLFLLAVASIIQIFFVAPAIDTAFNDGITERIVITQSDQDRNTEQYRDWIDNHNDNAPMQLFEFWIYNVTNPYDVPKGAYPSFDLIGPFTYRRYEKKTAPNNETQPPQFIEDELETIVIFDYVYRFEHLPERSSNVSLDDYVWTISGAMMGFFRNININVGSGDFYSACVDKALSKYPGHSVFYHVSIRNLTRGVRDPFIAQLDRYCANDSLWSFMRPNTFYSLIADGKNRVMQHTGKADITRVGELEEYRNFTTPLTNSYKLGAGDLWGHNETVAGARETRQFPPDHWIDEQSELMVWGIEKFRVTRYLFHHDVKYKGVDLMRFRLDDAELDACQYGYDNGSIVNESHTCKYKQFWEKGVANLTNLRGSPSFLSKGRFLDAPYFINNTNRAFGLPEPEQDRDDQYFDVDPRSGIVFRNWHNYQINFKFVQMDRPYPNNFTNFTIYERLIPFAYVRVEALATDDQMKEYRNTLRAMDLINELSLYGGPAAAVVFLVLMFLVICKMKGKEGMEGVPRLSTDEYGRLVEDVNDADKKSTSDIAMAQTNSNNMGGTSYGATNNNNNNNNNNVKQLKIQCCVCVF
eukprot:29600_1